MKRSWLSIMLVFWASYYVLADNTVYISLFDPVSQSRIELGEKADSIIKILGCPLEKVHVNKDQIGEPAIYDIFYEGVVFQYSDETNRIDWIRVLSDRFVVDGKVRVGDSLKKSKSLYALDNLIYGSISESNETFISISTRLPSTSVWKKTEQVIYFFYRNDTIYRIELVLYDM